MSKPSDVLIIAGVVAAVIWLNVPKLLLPLLLLAIGALAAYRWRRDGRQPMAAERYRARLMASCLVLGALSIPLILKLVPPNGFYGFRTSATRSNIAIWYPANAFLGWALLVAAVVSFVSVIYLPPTAKRGRLLVVFLLPLLGAVVASFMYLNRLT